MSPPLCVYHDPCRDGLTAAWVVQRALPDVELFPAQYNSTPLPEDLVRGRAVILVDFTWKRPVMDRLAVLATDVLVLDHHEGASEELDGYTEAHDHVTVIYDRERSGAQLAWDHFVGTEPRHWLVDYVADRDLWQWRLPWSREVNAAVALHTPDLPTWDRLTAQGEGPQVPGTLVTLGQGAHLLQLQLVQQALRFSQTGTWHGHPLRLVQSSILQSEIAEALYTADPTVIAGVWYEPRPGVCRYSFRTHRDGPDLLPLVTPLGGGGHRHAAGLQISRKTPLEP